MRVIGTASIGIKGPSWVHGTPVGPDLEVEVGPGRPAGIPQQGHLLSALHALTGLDQELRGVSIKGRDSSTMIDLHGQAIAAFRTRRQHHASRRSHDG